MNRISFQWRITLMTAVLIAGACICLNLLLYRSGATGMDNLNGMSCNTSRMMMKT